MTETPATKEVNRNKASFRGLIALNGALLIVLALVTFGSSVHGQARGRGEYTMAAGGVQGMQSAAVYIVDVANQEMLALGFNHNTRTMEGIGYRNIAADIASVQRGRNSRPTP